MSTKYALEADEAALTSPILIQVMCEDGKHGEVVRRCPHVERDMYVTDGSPHFFLDLLLLLLVGADNPLPDRGFGKG